MIHVPSDVYAALMGESPRTRLKTTWILNNGDERDLTDRVVGIGSMRRVLLPNMGGVRVGALTVSLRNDDRQLSPLNTASSSFFGPLSEKEFLGAKFRVELEVFGVATGWHAIPQFVGYVQTIELRGHIVDLKLEEIFSALMRRPMSDTVYVDPTLTIGEQIRTLLTTETNLVAGDIDSATTFAFAEAVQDDLDWTGIGTLPKGRQLGVMLAGLARSGFGTVYAQEDGLIVYDTQFPAISGDQQRVVGSYPNRFDETNSWDFEYARRSDTLATRVTVAYRGGGQARYFDKNDTVEASVGIIDLTIAFPALMWFRCARMAARILWVMHQSTVEAVTFSTGPRGAQVQLNDEIRVKDPDNDVEQAYRVQMKMADGEEHTIGAIVEHHKSDYVNTAFGKWDTTDWTDATARWW